MNEVQTDSSTDAPKTPSTGSRAIVVLDRGWIFVGDLATEGGVTTLSNCANLRKWSGGGFGGMVLSPKTSSVVLDPCANVIFDAGAPIFTVPVADDWNE